MNWLFYALMSAVFAALTTVLAKIGVKNVDSNLATAIRTLVIIIFAWGVVFFQGTYKNISGMPRYTLIFLILSGLATGLSWLFYFKALQVGPVSKVAPIDKLSLVLAVVFSVLVLKEKVSLTTLLGVGLMTAGTLIIVIFK